MVTSESALASGGSGTSVVAQTGFKRVRCRSGSKKLVSGASGAKSGGSKTVRVLRALCDVFWGILIALVISMVLWMFVVFKARVSSGSMEPTLATGSSILVGRLQTYFEDNEGLEYGDIAVFRSNLMTMGEALKLEEGSFHDNLYGDVPALFIKRVIGLPGDTIRLDAGLLYRNGELVDEPYVVYPDLMSVSEFTVPEGEFFVMGDNRANSFDGRYWDPHTVPLDAVIGEVILNW